MKHISFKSIVNCFLLLLLTGLLYNCGGNTPSRPKRKKMPELSSFQDFENADYSSGKNTVAISGGLNLDLSNIELETPDGVRSFVSIPLSDASADKVLIHMVQTLRPLALPLLSNWAREQNCGVLIDLSSHRGGGAVYQTNYALRQTGGFNIPVVIRWDRNSAYRAIQVRGLVQGVPWVSMIKTSGDDPLSFPNR